MPPTASSDNMTPHRHHARACQPAPMTAIDTNAVLRLETVALVASITLTALISFTPCATQAEAPGPALSAQLKEQVVLVQSTTTPGNGSGVILAADRVVTNCHVAEVAADRNTQLQVIEHAGAAPLPASLIARDPEHDLCLLAIDGALPLPTAGITRIAETAVQDGDPVYAAGAPGGYIDTVTSGIISGRRSLEGFPDPTKAWIASNFELCKASELDAAWYIQTDALFTPGSSGGGLFNANAELVGITTFRDRPHEELEERFAIRFVVPATHVRALLAMNPDKALHEVVKFFADARRYRHAYTASERIGSTTRQVRALVDIAKSQLSANRRPTAINTLRSATAVANTIEDPGKRAKRLRVVAEVLADAGEFGQASQVAASIEVPKERAQAYKEVARAQADLGRFDAANRIVRNIQDPGIRAQAYKEVARAQADLGHFDAANRTVRNIQDPGIRAQASDHTLRRQIRAWISAGDLRSAHRATSRIQDNVERVTELRRVARAYDELNHRESASRTRGEAVQQANHIVDLADRARALMDIAYDQNKADYPADPGPTVDAAIRTAEQIHTDTTRDKELSNIVSVLADMPQFIAIQADVAGRISDAHERDEAFKTIVETLAERGQFDAAEEWVEAIADPSIQGEAEQKIVGRLLEREAWVRATNLAERIEDRPSRAAARYDIVEAQADEAQIDAARRTADTIDDAVSVAKAYLYISDAAVHFDHVPPAVANELLEITERLIQEIADPDDRAKQLVDLAALYVDASRDPQARDALWALASTRQYARGLQRAAEAYAERREFDMAERLIDMIPQCAERQRRRAIDRLERQRARANR